MNETCNNLREIELIKKSKTFKIIERKTFDRIFITTDELELNWKVRGKIKDIKCKNFQNIINERRNPHE